MLVKSRPGRGTVFSGGSRKRKKLALIGRNPKLVVRGARLWDGRDEYRVADTQDRLDGRWVKVYNVQFPENERWFRLEDMAELSVILGDGS